MTELKTLKDFFHNCGNFSQTLHTCDFCNKPFLNGPKEESKFAVAFRQEAINTIKDVRRPDWDCGIENCDKDTHEAFKDGWVEGLKKMFNITEEDLK